MKDGAQIVDPQAKGIVSSVENVEYGTAKVMSKEEALCKRFTYLYWWNNRYCLYRRS